MEALRSMLFTPGHRRDLIEKAIRSGTDAVIIDLEDAVAMEAKADARALLSDAPRSRLMRLRVCSRRWADWCF